MKVFSAFALGLLIFLAVTAPAIALLLKIYKDYKEKKFKNKNNKK